jgi:ectoine hydroxylase-related dioxygenase (phytanoyl-CoA dioxygenase family)
LENQLRSLKNDEISAFERDGVICVRQVMPMRWIDLIAEAELGDVLMFHPLILHGSSGNSSRTQLRRALATRWSATTLYICAGKGANGVAS